MKQILLLVSCFLALKISAQPNLAVSYISTPASNLKLGDHLTFSFRIKNIGSSIAQTSHVNIYLSTTPSLANAVGLSTISTEALSVNAETQDIQYVFPVPYNLNNGAYYVIIFPDALHEIPGNTNTSIFYNVNTININSTGGNQNLPYPIILIHGFTGSDSTWDTLKNNLQTYYGYSFGGNMNFCLNQDNNIFTSNKNTDYKDWTVMSQLKAGDFYTVNFNTGINGKAVSDTTPDVESNQSAALKQGLAIRDAIKHVLQITGRNKVILLGHSMGGLAAREYLQNLTQADGYHHVAKLATIGTPHGGSNVTGLGLFGSFGFDEESEAVRDLKKFYAISFDNGVYLFGGQENYSVMNNSLIFDYNNVDVNCNGIDADNTNIIGLNQKNIPNDLSFSCGIGLVPVLGDDGVVTTTSANLNNFYNLSADTFHVNANHLAEPKKTPILMKLLDEANEYDKSYQINLDTTYFGNFTVQGLSSPYIVDYDDYKFSVQTSQMVNIKMYDIPITNCRIDILDNSYNYIYSLVSNGTGFLNFNIPLNTGIYYLEISATPDEIVWKSPYAYKLSLTGAGICPSSNTIMNAGITGSSYQWQVNIGSGYSNLSDNSFYSGTHSNYLVLYTPSTNWYGYKYRCIVDGSIISAENVLKFSSVWTGLINTQWENPNNWNCGILPDQNTDVIINSNVPNQPQVNFNQSCRSLNISTSAQILIKTGVNLKITGVN